MKKRLAVVLAITVLGFLAGKVFLNAIYYPPILMYHSLDRATYGSQLGVSEDVFREQMEFLKQHKFRVISLKDLAQMIRESRPIPKRSVVITFDDGYKDNLKAVEVLREYGFPAIIFIPVIFVDKEGYLSTDDIRYIDGLDGIDIGVHGYGHKYLPEAKNLIREIVFPWRFWRGLLGHSVYAISYPIGGFNRDIQAIVKRSGYLVAVTTNRGYDKGIDIYALRRAKVKNSDRGLRFWFKVSGYYDFFRKLRRPE